MRLEETLKEIQKLRKMFDELREVRLLKAAFVGGGMAKNGYSHKDIDIISVYREEFNTLDANEQARIANNTRDILPVWLGELPVDTRFLEVHCESGRLFGRVDCTNDNIDDDIVVLGGKEVILDVVGHNKPSPTHIQGHTFYSKHGGDDDA